MKLTGTLIGLLFGQGNSMPLASFSRLAKSRPGRTVMNNMDADLVKPSFWQSVFLQSKVNGASYNGDGLPGRHWNWPKDTYLQRRFQGFQRPKWCQNTDSSN
jgi:hypothetical protein